MVQVDPDQIIPSVARQFYLMQENFNLFFFAGEDTLHKRSNVNIMYVWDLNVWPIGRQVLIQFPCFYRDRLPCGVSFYSELSLSILC